MHPEGKQVTQSTSQAEVSDGTIRVAGKQVKYFVLDRSKYDAIWLERQLNSVEEYEQTHVEAIVDDHNNRLSILFRNFLSSAVLDMVSSKGTIRRLNVLDVGCGIHSERPPYISNQLAETVNYYGLDPLEVNLDSRSYPLFLGDLTQLANQDNLESVFDLVIFCTSLDHIDSLEQTIEELHTLTTPGATAIFWCGVHDPEITGEHNGSLVFRKLLSRGGLAGYLSFLLYGIFRLPRLLTRAGLTRYRLGHGIPLDDLHERYFTSDTLEDTVEKFGEVLSSVRVPGSNSVFHCVSLHEIQGGQKS